jgi:hypothetical protein
MAKWKPVRPLKTRQNKSREREIDSIKSHRALEILQILNDFMAAQSTALAPRARQA